jgi:DNA polymerase III subunit alpha
MNKYFTPLHLHTEYSLLDGAMTLPRLIERAKLLDFKSLAITDHGNVFGAVKFFGLCKKAGIKPVLGMEAYLAEDARVKNHENRYYHLVLLVQDKEGYKNLCKLISYSYTDGFYFKPRIDYAMLEKHSKGLIATSACLGGHIPKLLFEGNTEKVDEKIAWFNHYFKDRFFFEVQPADFEDQKRLNSLLYPLSEKYNIPLVATSDSHYLTKDDREAHEVMLTIQTQDTFDNPKRYTFGECRVHVRGMEEMLVAFPDHPQAVYQSGEIAAMCDFSFATGKLYFPQSPIPVAETPESYFKALCYKGLQRLLDREIIAEAKKEIYEKRLEEEIQLITNMGFIGYFLVVADFIQWAHKSGIPVGPGRGSAAGSVVSWVLQITNIDPLKYNLLFERFLNPERVSMPDIDIDFCIEGRERVIQYVRDRYGHDKVCHIITFGTMLAKGVIKDVSRVLGLPFEDSNAITALVPDQLKITLDEAISAEPKLQKLIEENQTVKHIFEIAKRLEGVTRHASKHAAGIVISPDPIDEVLPIYVPAKSNELVSQYSMTDLETLGFLKIDLLGLKNLTLIDRVLQLIKKNHSTVIDIEKIPLEDEPSFALIAAGNTSGVFQLESSGLKEVLKKLKPSKFEEIIAVNALYRPGPLGSGMVDDFIECKHGRQEITYIFPELAPILEETYGVIVYQEQVLKIASAIAGYSLGESDILRKAMGKKKPEEMEKQSKIFISRAEERGFDAQKAHELFDLMAYFAGYGFNKAHSAAYALIAYQTAYLKAHYPAEFMAELISLESANPEQMCFYIAESKAMGLEVLPPDINRSEVRFSVVEGKILFGIQGIKSVGSSALETIMEARKKNGPFTDLLDFCKRVDLRAVNKRVLEHLIFAGAFSQFPGNRAQQCDELSSIIEQALAHKKAVLTGQMTLFAGFSQDTENKKTAYVFKPREEWSNAELLAREYEVLGLYMSAHPLSGYQEQLKLLSVSPMSELKDKNIVIVAGVIKDKKEVITKKGDRMAFVTLEDGVSSASIIIFPKLFASIEKHLEEYATFVCRGTIDTESASAKIKADSFIPLDLIFEDQKYIKQIVIRHNEQLREDGLQRIKSRFLEGNVELKMLFVEQEKTLQLSANKKVRCQKTDLLQLQKELPITISCLF